MQKADNHFKKSNVKLPNTENEITQMTFCDDVTRKGGGSYYSWRVNSRAAICRLRFTVFCIATE
jgi:hypothetical protein